MSFQNSATPRHPGYTERHWWQLAVSLSNPQDQNFWMVIGRYKSSSPGGSLFFGMVIPKGEWELWSNSDCLVGFMITQPYGYDGVLKEPRTHYHLSGVGNSNQLCADDFEPNRSVKMVTCSPTMKQPANRYKEYHRIPILPGIYQGH